MKKQEVKAVRIKSAQRLQAKAGKKAAPAAHVAAGAKPAAEVAKDAKATPVAAGGEATNPLEAPYRTQKDAAKTEKAAKVAAWRKEVAEKGARPDPELDKAIKAAEEGRAAKKATAAKPKGERKPGILTLAADVLKDAKAPMDCKAIVEKVLAKGTWQTQGQNAGRHPLRGHHPRDRREGQGGQVPQDRPGPIRVERRRTPVASNHLRNAPGRSMLGRVFGLSLTVRLP